MNEKIIDGKIVRMSNKHEGYGSTRCGIVYLWSTEKKARVHLRGGGNSTPYHCFNCRKNGKNNSAFVHVVVADCWVFNDSPDHKIVVNHIDGDKNNNHSENLEWCTRSQNQRHAFSTGLSPKGADHPNSYLDPNQVHLICQRLQEGWRVKDITDSFGVPQTVIKKIKSGDSYINIRSLYIIENKFYYSLSESTVRWVCERMKEGLSDKKISLISSNKNLSVIEVRRIRNKIRYKTISDEYL
jgi:hypothetical protein